MKPEGSLSRREFLKLAGAAGATVGAAGGLGALVSACGGEETTTTQVSAPSSSTAAPATTASSSVGGATRLPCLLRPRPDARSRSAG